MPLSTGATWPSLLNRTASAADVNAKFEWLEGHRYPHSSGGLTTGAYDVGSASYIWASGYFNSIVLGGVALGSDVPGKTLDAWAFANTGTFTTTAAFNVSSVTQFFGVSGTDAGLSFNFTNTMTTNKYAVCASTIYRTYIISMSTDYVRLISRTTTDYPTGSGSISFMARQ